MILEGAVPMSMAGGAVQSFISGGRMNKSKMSHMSHSVIFKEITFQPESFTAITSCSA